MSAALITELADATKATGTIDLSGITNLGTDMMNFHDLSGNTAATTVKLPAGYMDIVTLNASVTSVEADTDSIVVGAQELPLLKYLDLGLPFLFKTDGSIAFPATLDLSSCTGLGTTLDLTGMDPNVLALVVPDSVTTLTVPATVFAVGSELIYGNGYRFSGYRDDWIFFNNSKLGKGTC